MITRIIPSALTMWDVVVRGPWIRWGMRRSTETSVLGVAAMIGLLIKFLWPLFVFDVPLGYDPGFYRYLFVHHAEALPPFVLPDLAPWARGHPLGLFFFSSLLLKAGLPVDWLIGWMWNLVPVILAAIYAWIIRRRYGLTVGVLTLLAALLSIAFFDGFAAMYWKTYAALFWMILTFAALEHRSWWSVPLGILTVATHHQTGLLFGLVFGTWIILSSIAMRMEKERRPVGRLYTMRQSVMMVVVGLCIVLIGAATYAPIWQDAVLVHIPALLDRSVAAAGSFPPPLFYLQTSGVLLLLGIIGFVGDVRRERWTVWQLAFLWSAVFVCLRLLFYRRFLLQLDFFLLPFVAIGIRDLWVRYQRRAVRVCLIAALVAQGMVMVLVVRTRGPIVDAQTFAAIERLPSLLPADALVLSLENQSVVVLRGWLPYHRVGGPGLFDASWSYAEWEKFLLGTDAERQAFLRALPVSTYLFVSPFFRSYYGDRAVSLLHDPCLVPSVEPLLLRVECPTLPHD